MNDDSAPGYITIRTPPTQGPTAEAGAYDVYEVALELVRLVHLVIEASSARFHLKDRLDQATTQVALKIARAGQQPASDRRKAYRDVLATVTDISTLLDVVDKQRGTSRPGDLDAARYVARRLAVQLAPLAMIRTTTTV